MEETLNSHYKILKISEFEGHIKEHAQIKLLKKFATQPNILSIMEIGFNAGHSAEIFLSENAELKLTSFDLGNHHYVTIGKEFIDKKFPNRHTLLLGDSRKTLPDFIKNNNVKFDLIFIDGGHNYNIAKSDIINCKKLAKRNTIVIMDDTMNNNNWLEDWNHGPNKAWIEAIESGMIEQIGTEDYSKGIGNSWGKYKI